MKSGLDLKGLGRNYLLVCLGLGEGNGETLEGIPGSIGKERIWKGVYGARRDERPAPKVKCVLGGRGFVPLLPFPSE